MHSDVRKVTILPRLSNWQILGFLWPHLEAPLQLILLQPVSCVIALAAAVLSTALCGALALDIPTVMLKHTLPGFIFIAAVIGTAYSTARQFGTLSSEPSILRVDAYTLSTVIALVAPLSAVWSARAILSNHWPFSLLTSLEGKLLASVFSMVMICGWSVAVYCRVMSRARNFNVETEAV